MKLPKDPSKVSYYFNLANSYYRNKMYPEAASEYKNVILKDPKLAYAAKYYLSQVLYYDKKLKEFKPDYLVILPWNIKSEIIRQIKNSELKTKFITAIPKIIIDN